MTQAACMGWQTQSAELGPLAQYSIPVALSTARPDGDVVHEVKYAMMHSHNQVVPGTTIEQIRRLNNLTDNIVVPGWKLLVQKGATQPPPSSMPPATFEPVRQNLYTSTPRITSTPAATEIGHSSNAGQFIKQNSMVIVAFVISFSVLVAGIVGFGKKKE